MLQQNRTRHVPVGSEVNGDFVTVAGERFYAIRNVDRMAPFFMSIVSNQDHWLFISSTGGLTAGRISPDTALLPYISVDKIHESAPHTGSKTVMRIRQGGECYTWEPFILEHTGRLNITRNLYKNILGNKVRFEEVNHDLRLAFSYTWATSDRYGFVRNCELRNLDERAVTIELLDGLQNILPAGTPRVTQTNASNLVDAYKWAELDEATGLASYCLYSGISDRAEPSESLRANTVFCLGLDVQTTLLSAAQLNGFRTSKKLQLETGKRGTRGAYFVSTTLDLAPLSSQKWCIVADVEKTQAQVVKLRQQLRQEDELAAAIIDSIEAGCNDLARIMASADAFQLTNEEPVSVHHYANVLFNVLRGGIFDEQYTVSSQDFVASVRLFNRHVFKRNSALLNALPEKLDFQKLVAIVGQHGDEQLERLCREYLPITFGRRHGDPSRPWNQFAIRLHDNSGKRLLSYQGNWRDIFQNWEALLVSYPQFAENVIAKFVNASTIDGYNPYRITSDGIDWEIKEHDNPWSYIGYWGDHQIIYLQKLVELSEQFHPRQLAALLRRPIFSYANVPYRIKPFASLLNNPKQTVEYDYALSDLVEQRVASIGADGKLLLDSRGDVYQVNLLEKLLVPLLSKLGNLVIDGGIWLNTQRPEWNDANNALVGYGLSMVTLYYVRRYVHSLRELLTTETRMFELSTEVADWLSDTAIALAELRPLLEKPSISPADRYASLQQLGQAASRYRETVYQRGSFAGKQQQSPAPVLTMLDDALLAIDHSISSNRRPDGLYNAYNLMDLQADTILVDNLYPMLEGQVAALSAGTIPPQQALSLVEALFDSDIYREDQQSFMLYPDRKLPGFLEKNRISPADVQQVPLLTRMLSAEDASVVTRDLDGHYRFNADFRNVGDLNAALNELTATYGTEVDASLEPLQKLYEKVFNHRAFTGRSGGMFGFEGLGCIYWHMVSKLLLVVQENFFAALQTGADPSTCHRLGSLYYRIRGGLGFNKSPAEYGAFPTDPYSHTPRHTGAQQPGMTGSVKEEILARFGELGVRVNNGEIRFETRLLRSSEFISESQPFRYLDVDGQWQEISISANGLAFSWCQVPIIYRLGNVLELQVSRDDGSCLAMPSLRIPAADSAELFRRSGRIRQISLTLTPRVLRSD